MKKCRDGTPAMIHQSLNATVIQERERYEEREKEREGEEKKENLLRLFLCLYLTELQFLKQSKRRQLHKLYRTKKMHV